MRLGLLLATVGAAPAGLFLLVYFDLGPALVLNDVSR